MEILDFEVPGAAGDRVPALLAGPPSAGDAVGVVVLAHPATGSRETFRRECAALARAGWLALSLDGPARRRPPALGRGLAHPAGERALLEQSAGDVGSALDALEARAGGSFRRYAFVGRNYGVTVGALLAAREPRLGAFVLQGGIPSLSAFWRTSSHPAAADARAKVSAAQLAAFCDATADLDASRQTAALARRRVLLQFGRHDDWVPASAVAAAFGDGPLATALRWYDDDHAMASPLVLADCLAALGSWADEP